MTKTRFTVDIFAKGTNNSPVLDMITNHNEGTAKIDYTVIQGWLKAIDARYPGTPQSETIIDEETGTMVIKEGSKITLILTERLISELEPVNEIQNNGQI